MISVATVCALMVVFAAGALYSIYIVEHPPQKGRTWLSVVIGCSFTNLAISVILWDRTHRIDTIVAVWVCYLLTGLPVVAGQLFKRKGGPGG